MRAATKAAVHHPQGDALAIFRAAFCDHCAPSVHHRGRSSHALLALSNRKPVFHLRLGRRAAELRRFRERGAQLNFKLNTVASASTGTLHDGNECSGCINGVFYRFDLRGKTWVPRLLQKVGDIDLACVQPATSRTGKFPVGANLRPNPG